MNSRRLLDFDIIADTVSVTNIAGRIDVISSI